ncbi:sugar ABC transporter permease [Dactylosporangium sp. NPDC049525]|uniref:carbohydrate ABC transporter permease n=1 Tax=Dactylosporangium sp. NPDC049525 TaxID=3154730 RepID=UPI003436258F
MVGPRGVRKFGIVALFLLPSAVPLLLFTIAPMFGAAWISLHSWNLQSPMQWTGLDNFTRLLGDAETRDALLHTLYFLALYLPLVYLLGLALAVGLNRRFPGRSLLRSMYFLPVVTSWVVVALTWKWLLNPANGLVNHVLESVGIAGPGWWASAGWAIPSAVVASVWKDAGFVMVILLAGLQSIPEEYLEAARLDGASAWQSFWRVTFPLLTPSSYFVVVISLISGFQVFDQIYVMTGGGPAGASRPLVEEIYDLTFRYGDAGGASALSLLLFALILLVTVIQQRLQRRWVTYV